MWYGITFLVGALTGFAIAFCIVLIWVIGEVTYDK